MPANTAHEKPELHLWLVNINHLQEADWTELEKHLSDDERATAERKKNKQTYITSRALTRLALANHLEETPRNLVFDKHEKGKPFLPKHPEIAFNLSHSDDWVAFALCDKGLVGVDIEHHKPRDYLAIAENYFHKDELNNLSELPHGSQAQASLFFQYWTLKESFFKALGSGIVTGLDRANFSDFSADASAVFDPELPQSPSDWLFYYHLIDKDTSLALSINDPKAKLRIHTEWRNLLK